MFKDHKEVGQIAEETQKSSEEIGADAEYICLLFSPFCLIYFCFCSYKILLFLFNLDNVKSKDISESKRCTDSVSRSIQIM